MTTAATADGAAPAASDEAAGALRANPFFGGATDAEIAALARACRIEAVPAGRTVVKEGDVADDLYLLLGGELLVFSHDELGRAVALARISGINEIVGEQAFVGEGKRRAASVKAVSDARLLRVPGDAFRALLQRDHALGQRLRDLGAGQIRNKVSQQMPLLRHLAGAAAAGAGLQEKMFPADAVVCRQGDTGQEFYVILSGSVRVFRTESDGSIVQLARLQAGQSFGELSLIEGTSRSATVVAEGDLRVLAIGVDDFLRAYQADEEVRGHFAGLRSIYSYRGAGVAVQFAAEMFERPAIATLYRLEGGRSVIAHRVVGQDIWSIQQTEMPADVVERDFVDLARGIDRTLTMRGDLVVGGVVSGAWAGIGRLHALVLQQIPLPPDQVAQFRRTGELAEATAASRDESIVCSCMHITRNAVTAARESGCHTVRSLSARTGAGTVCGGCLPRLTEITAETQWLPVSCLEVIDRGPLVKSFRLQVPDAHRDVTVRPGQRIMIQAVIAGATVARAYTLTSPVTERRYYEITVQREPHGVMSSWMLDHLRPGTTVETLPPSGTCFFDLAEPRPLICLVGGIGVTPALGICRSGVASRATRRTHVDYSASARDEIICAEELTELASRHPALTARARVTREEGRFQTADLARLTAELPDADWLICGPKAFNADAQKQLLDLGVPAHRLHIEAFDAVGGALTGEQAAATSSSVRRAILGRGLLIGSVAVGLLALLEIAWPPFGGLPAMPWSRHVTAVGLLVLLVLQCRLAHARRREPAQATSRAGGMEMVIGTAVLALTWLHGGRGGADLGAAVTAAALASVAAGAVAGIVSTSPRREREQRALRAGYLALSCVAAALAAAHALIALWS